MITKFTIWFLYLHPLSYFQNLQYNKSFSSEPLSQFQSNLARSFFWINGLQISLNIVAVKWKYIDHFEKSFTPEPLDTKHLHVFGKGIQVCSNQRPRPVPREDYSDIVKTYWWLLQSSLSKYQPNLVHSILGDCIHVYTNERPFSPQKASNDSWTFFYLTNVLVKSQLCSSLLFLRWAICPMSPLINSVGEARIITNFSVSFNINMYPVFAKRTFLSFNKLSQHC